MRDLFSKIKAYQARGGSWIQVITIFGIVTANIALFKDDLELIGIGVIEAIILAGIIYVLGTIFVGWVDATYGIWGKELAVSSNLNPVINTMSKKVNDVHRIVKKRRRVLR